GNDGLPTAPAPGLTSFVVDKGSDLHALHPAGFAVIARRAIRFDMLERVEGRLEKALITGTDGDSVLTQVISLMGASKEEGMSVLTALGWHLTQVKDAAPVWRRRPRTKARTQGKNRRARSRAL